MIEDRHIKEAERILIGGNEFDKTERIPFIKRLSSCDLLAVPGSGKTTALLAKLYCLSKKQPLKDGAGILVLSHTNAAVDEIEKTLKPHCLNLFEYPNFVGTVQGFVNKFLANPACQMKYESYISINDNDVFEKEAESFFYSLKYSSKNVEPKNLKNKLFGKVNHGKDDLSNQEKEENIKTFLKYFELNILERKVIYNENSFYTYNGNSQPYYLELEHWRESLYRKGILNYKDSYSLGFWYLNTYPISSILQKRFKYVFVDEMQDLETFQIEIIDKIFLYNGTETVIQRIGDINQAIYNSGKKVKIEANWKPRNQMYLNDSNRLTPEIASLVNCFTLDRQQCEKGNPRFIVNGLRRLDTEIKPHLILFDNESMGNLENKFEELIKSFSLHETMEGKKYGFKIIGWNAKWDDDEEHNNKLRLENIFESYKKEAKSKKETFDFLCKYLQLLDYDKLTLESARRAILNSLIHILRIEGKTHPVKVRGKTQERYYAKNEMIIFIQKDCDYESFKASIFQWTYKLMVHRDIEGVYNAVKLFVLEDFKTWFDFTPSDKTISFLGENFENIVMSDKKSETKKENQTKIDINTVHSVKGQTHCATMYVETSYYNYETEKLNVVEKKRTLNNPLFKQEHEYKKTRDRETLKMMYVGFSRPTHLLCFAALKENVKNNLDDFTNSGWEIIDITENNIHTPSKPNQS